MAKTNKAVEIKMSREKECKGSIRFASDDDEAVVTNVYVNRSMEGIEDAKEITVTVAAA